MKRKKSKHICKQHIYTYDDEGVDIRIDIEKVMHLLKNKMLKAMKSNAKYAECLSVEGLSMNNVSIWVKEILELKANIIKAKSMEKAYEEIIVNDKEMNDIVRRTVDEELGIDKEETIAELMLKTTLHHIDG